MAISRKNRESKAQLGQFLTPQALADKVIDGSSITFTKDMTILEPSLGAGSFVFSVIDKLIPLYLEEGHSFYESLARIVKHNVYGVEFDAPMFDKFCEAFLKKYDVDLDSLEHNFLCQDFFRYVAPVKFDLIVGNPPFGGTFDIEIEDHLDRTYGRYRGVKIKKETYAFFTVICLGMMSQNGRLVFILSDTFLTINTMKGLRLLCLNSGDVDIKSLTYFSEETSYGMVILNVNIRANPLDYITVDESKNLRSTITLTPNLSFNPFNDIALLFSGKSLSEYITASSGMTIGNNDLFLRKIHSSTVIEEYAFYYEFETLSLEKEFSRARLGKIGDKRLAELNRLISSGATEKILKFSTLSEPETVSLPNNNYIFYNKAIHKKWFSEPQTMIYWKDDGEAVYTFKKNSPWYLHGVGGKPFFKLEGITWPLISSTLKARYLPSGYILDSGSPVAVLKNNINPNELWFILGWLNTDLATRILKNVINHTKNIQGKDVERLPYPWWVSNKTKLKIIDLVKSIVANPDTINDDLNLKLEEMFSYEESKEAFALNAQL